jgi:hypothetical protein
LAGKENWLTVLKACSVSPEGAPARACPPAQAVSWLLDTDNALRALVAWRLIGQPAKRHGDARVIAWLELEQDRCYTSAVVIAQLAYWIRTKEGRQSQAAQASTLFT